MSRYGRIFIALTILLSGLALVPQAGFFAGVVRWQRFAGGYEDVVTVTRARYDTDDNDLEVRAVSSSGAQATLSVYRTGDDAFIGELTYDSSSGEHRGTFIVPTDPQVITVRSSLGGESTVLVTTNGDVPVTVTPSATPTIEPGNIKLHFPLMMVEGPTSSP